MTHTPNNIRVEQVSMREKFARVVAWHCYGPWESLQSGFREKDRCLRIADELLAFLSSTRPSDEIVEALETALEPVWHWYQSDEHEDRPLLDIVRDIVADLQHDRAMALQVQALHRAGANLSICAQTTGGVAGPDAGLMLAIQQWAEADAPVRAALSTSNSSVTVEEEKAG